MTALTDELEERIEDLENELEEAVIGSAVTEHYLNQSERHNYELAAAIDDAIADLKVFGEVPLGDVPSSIEALIERLKEAL